MGQNVNFCNGAKKEIEHEVKLQKALKPSKFI